ncbi:alpha/beta hydrolase family protein [Roseateles amylovorans]|uniref:Dienelactone hydrolase n=1 Tax=Roseateles amylovorans TaxID=2978473 RepID=A0ABY6AYS7_9BURK|nr:hypothetical protein [Roseateles amylovorans]UXH77837.1 hypothetical protein N4261_23160 [Roseateles amylovorans]
MSAPPAERPVRRALAAVGRRSAGAVWLGLSIAGHAGAAGPQPVSASPSPMAAPAPRLVSPWAPDIREAVIQVPVTVRDADGRTLRGELPVTTFRPAGSGPFPLVVINHGRDLRHRLNYERQRYESAARFFIRKGFAVAVPLRLGYGELARVGDPESSLSCQQPRFAAAMEVAGAQVAAVVRSLALAPDIDPRRIVLVGQSVGGLAVLSALPMLQEADVGVIAAINFAGGHGANPQASPGQPCRPDLLQQEIARMGSALGRPLAVASRERDPTSSVGANRNPSDGTDGDAHEARDAPSWQGRSPDGRPSRRGSMPMDGATTGAALPVPTLWLYAENDRSFAPARAHAWAQAYRQAGGAATLQLLPPFGEDGHRLFTDGNDRWQPWVDDFLRPLGVDLPGALPFPTGGRVAVEDEGALPPSPRELHQLYRQFLAARTPRAFAMNGQSRSAFATGDDAQSRALAACEQGAQAEEPCRLYAVNHTVVWSFP